MLLRARGGRISDGWIVLGGLSLSEAVSWGILYYAFSALVRPMEAEMGWSRTETSAAFSLGLLASATGAPAVGRIIDRRGPRLLMTAGSALGVLLVLAWSRVRTLAAFYAVWIGIGLAMSAVLYEPAFASVTRWFRRDRERALMIVTLVAGMASAVFLPLTSHLVDRFGWRCALVILAGILASTTIPLHAILLRPPGGELQLGRRGRATVTSLAPRPTPIGMPAADAVRTFAFWLLTLALVLSGLATGALAVHLVPYLVEEGYTPMVSASVVGALGAMQLPGRLLFAPLSREVSQRRLTSGVFLLQGLGLATLIFARGPVGLAAFVMAFGMGSGLMTLTRAALVAEVYGTIHYGSVAGIVAAFTTTARALGPIMAARAHEVTGGYEPALGMLAAGLVFASAAALHLGGGDRPPRVDLPGTAHYGCSNVSTPRRSPAEPTARRSDRGNRPRRRARKAPLAKGDRSFRTVFDRALDAMVVLDDAGHYLEVNPAACALFGRPRAELLKLSVGGVSAPGLKVTHVWKDVRARGHAAGDWRIARPDGTVRDVEFAATAGFLPGLNLAVIRDVTDRNRRAAQLQALADAAITIGRASSLEEITREATEAARRVIGAHQAVTSFTLDENWAQAIHHVSLSEKYAEYERYDGKPDGSGIYHVVCKTNRPLRLTQAEIEAHPAWRGFGKEAGRHPPMRGWLAAPFVGSDGHNLGLIQLSDKYDGEFGEDDDAILVQLAQLVSSAAESTRLLQEVRLAHERMQALSWRLVHLQEEERRTIARELHDEVGPILTSLKFLVEASERTGTVVGREQANEMTRQLLDRIRDLSLNLRPPMLDDLGLVPTLLWHLERYRAQTGIEVRFHHRGVDRRLDMVMEITAFRIIQEALTNVARHAQVDAAAVDVWARDGLLCIRVEDHGRGFEPSELPSESMGLTGMRERALLLGGRLRVESSIGLGTRILADLPVLPTVATP